MKTEFQAKFIQHLVSKKDNEGFTLIELLVVIIIIGILAAIALPAFLNQATKAKQSEARTYVGSMNRAQQAYYMENGYSFANEANKNRLGLGIKSSTNNYTYVIEEGGNNATQVFNLGQLPAAKTSPLKSYIGGVFSTVVNNEATTIALLCEAKDPSNVGTQMTGATGEKSNVTKDKCDGTNYVQAGK